MEPIRIQPEIPKPPSGSPIGRALRATLIERRLPYQLGVQLDRLMLRLNHPHKTIRHRDYTIRLRRLSPHEIVVKEVLGQNEYALPGFEIGLEDCVVDVGGNIGTFALWAARQARRGRIYSFEPVLENFKLLQENLKLNRIANVTPMRGAVMGQSGTVRILTRELANARLAGTGVSSPSEPGEEVDAYTLSEIFEMNGIDRCHYLKLDCEGAEYDILAKLPSETAERIDRVVMEYHARRPETKIDDARELLDHLQAKGFTIERWTDTLGYNTGHIWARRARP